MFFKFLNKFWKKEEKQKEDYLEIDFLVDKEGIISIDLNLQHKKETRYDNLAMLIYLLTTGRLNEEIYAFLLRCDHEEINRIAKILDNLSLEERAGSQIPNGKQVAIHPLKVFQGRRL